VSEPDRPAWHWDEVRALRDELAAQTETAAAIAAALRAEVARLEREKEGLLAELASAQARAQVQGERAQLATEALARLMRTAKLRPERS